MLTPVTTLTELARLEPLRLAFSKRPYTMAIPPFRSGVLLPAMKCWQLTFALSLSLSIAGCGTSNECSFGSLSVSPRTATADHAAPPPGNSQRFLAFGGDLPSGCAAVTSNLMNVTWSVSDPVNVTISNAQDSTFGTATCIASTPTSVTVTATLPAGKNNGSQVAGEAALACN